jgi:hypothetical protein
MSKREEEKAVEATKKVAEQAKSIADKQEATATLQEIRQQETVQQFQESVNTSLDETKKNVRRSIDEARNQIPQYTNVVKNYQEQALESTGKIVSRLLFSKLGLLAINIIIIFFPIRCMSKIMGVNISTTDILKFLH